jgi:hypothetical protein
MLFIQSANPRHLSGDTGIVTPNVGDISFFHTTFSTPPWDYSEVD